MRSPLNLSTRGLLAVLALLVSAFGGGRMAQTWTVSADDDEQARWYAADDAALISSAEDAADPFDLPPAATISSGIAAHCAALACPVAVDAVVTTLRLGSARGARAPC